jgi:SAM-dependent methyltransferase
MTRAADGSAGDHDYGRTGAVYPTYRQPDPRIAAAVHAALDGARTVLNVGAGAGSYEPTDREVTPVEPSAAMRAHRPPHLAPAVDAVADDLPFEDHAFDAAMGTFTVHQWPDLAAGLREVRRVTRGPVVLLTCDPAALADWWLARYSPEVIATEARRYPAMHELTRLLGGGERVTVDVVPIPLDCTDGFNDAYYGRPERLLDPGARQANSAWGFVAPAAVERFERHLRGDLESGAWDARFGHLRTQPRFDGALRLVVGRP